MRYPPSEKLEIIRLVEGSHLSARLTLAPKWFCPTVNNNHPIPNELSKHYNQVLGAWSNVRGSWSPVHEPRQDGPGTPGQV